MKIMSRRLKIFLMTIAAILIIYSKTISWMLGSWVFNPYYSHGFLVLAICLYIGYKKSKEIEHSGASSFGLILVAIALIIHAIATVYNLDYISAMTIPFAIFGVIVSFYGLSVAKRFLFPVFFILFAVPYPIYTISNVLEVLSATTSVNILKFFGFEVFNIGAEIHLKSGTFIVGAPCSGIRSIIALLTVSALYVYIIKDSMLIKTILISLSVPLAILANILRISTILITAEVFGRDIALNVVHYLSDVIFFTIAVVSLMIIRRCLSWMSDLLS